MKTKSTDLFALVGQLKAAVVAAQLSLNERFNALREEGERMKEADPSIVLPWGDSAPYTPPADQRRYQVENIYDAILKVLPRTENNAIPTNEVIRRIQALHLSYSECTIRQGLSNIGEYVDAKGWGMTLAPNPETPKIGRPGYVYWKFHA